MKFRPGGFFDLLFNIELKKVGVKIFREISYFSSPAWYFLIFENSEISKIFENSCEMQVKFGVCEGSNF